MLKHGHKRAGHVSPEYKTWLGIKRRCSDEGFKDYANYGAKGIRVSPEWDASFMQFLSDMGPKPTLTHQIDRMNSKLGYSKENCRWVTPQVQGAENRSSLIPIDVGGMHFHSLKAAAVHFGINVTTVHYRLNSGVPLEQAFAKGEKRMKSRRTRESFLHKDHPDRQ